MAGRVVVAARAREAMGEAGTRTRRAPRRRAYEQRENGGGRWWLRRGWARGATRAWTCRWWWVAGGKEEATPAVSVVTRRASDEA